MPQGDRTSKHHLPTLNLIVPTNNYRDIDPGSERVETLCNVRKDDRPTPYRRKLLRSLVYHVGDLFIYAKCMSSQYDVSTVYSVFNNLLQDLEGFIDPHQLEIVFDAKKQAFLCGPGFREQLTANPTLAREIRKEMRDILAKHLGRHITG